LCDASNPRRIERFVEGVSGVAYDVDQPKQCVEARGHHDLGEFEALFARFRHGDVMVAEDGAQLVAGSSFDTVGRSEQPLRIDQRRAAVMLAVQREVPEPRLLPLLGSHPADQRLRCAPTADPWSSASASRSQLECAASRCAYEVSAPQAPSSADFHETVLKRQMRSLDTALGRRSVRATHRC
jgi:hypothetical protein